MEKEKAGRRLTILDLLLMVAGMSFGLWLAIGMTNGAPGDDETWLAFLVFVLGGLTAIGPPLLLWERYRRRRRLRLGELLWFCQGTASWLLWPPVVFYRLQGTGNRAMAPMAPICYVYGTPLMALYVTIALLAGGWLPRRRRRAHRSWTETFGLILALVWACTGLYVLVLIYRKDLLQ
jgi:hypothetical protein